LTDCSPTPIAKALENLHLPQSQRAGGIVQFRRFLLFAILGILAAPAAFAQQAQFNPSQCEGRTAQDCNDLMSSYGLPSEDRQQVLLLRATALLQKHDLEGTIAEYREMTVIDPHGWMAYSTLGFLESIGEKWPEAVTDLKRAIEIAPDQDRIRAMLAVALAKSGDCSGAKAALTEEKARAKDPSTVTTAEQTVGDACH
jgi:tetratricopeptide (TPR) repeat protein